MDRVNNNHLKIIRLITGAYPVVDAIVSLIDSVLCLYGGIEIYPYYIIIDKSLLFCIMLLALSKTFKFCLWHRLLVYSMMICCVIDYANVLYPGLMDGMISLYAVLMCYLAFPLGSIISLFFKNRETNGKQ